jgi:uncharacterized protein (TIGR03066 family)
MQILRWTLIGCLVAGLAGCDGSGSKVKVDKDKLIGVWELTKSTGGPPIPADTTLYIEFLKDGKMKDISKEGNRPETITSTRPYKIEGDILEVTNPSGGGAGMQIKKLTDTELVTEFFGETREYKKKK